MDFKCFIPDCSQLAFWHCSCERKIKICSNHISSESHFSKESCLAKNIEQKYKKHLADIYYARNVLSNLSQSMLKLSIKMMNCIDTCVVENINFLKEKHIIIDQAISSGNNELLKNLINWANNFDIQKRDDSFFSSSVLNLLSLRDDYARQTPEVDILKSQINENKKSYHEACEIIESLKKELGNYKVWCTDIEKEKNYFKESYEKLLSEIDMNSKRYLGGNWKGKRE